MHKFRPNSNKTRIWTLKKRIRPAGLFWGFTVSSFKNLACHGKVTLRVSLYFQLLADLDKSNLQKSKLMSKQKQMGMVFFTKNQTLNLNPSLVESVASLDMDQSNLQVNSLEKNLVDSWQKLIRFWLKIQRTIFYLKITGLDKASPQRGVCGGLCNPSYWDGGIWGWLEDGSPPWRLLGPLERPHLA